jgi:hypothetical protein
MTVQLELSSTALAENLVDLGERNGVGKRIGDEQGTVS